MPRLSFPNYNLNLKVVSKLGPIASCETINNTSSSHENNLDKEDSTTGESNDNTIKDKINIENKRNSSHSPISPVNQTSNHTKTVSFSENSVINVGPIFSPNASTTPSRTNSSSANNSSTQRSSSLASYTNRSSLIEAVLNNFAKVNVTDGIVNKKTDTGKKMSLSSSPLVASMDVNNNGKSVTNSAQINSNHIKQNHISQIDEEKSRENSLNKITKLNTSANSTSNNSQSMYHVEPDDYDSEEDSNLRKKFIEVARNFDNKEAKSSSSLNGSISSASTRLSVSLNGCF